MKKILFSLILAMKLSLCYGGEVIETTINQFKETLAQNKNDKLVIFFATWCSYCKPIVLSKDLPKEKTIFISIDSDKEAIDLFSKEMVYSVYHITPNDDMTNLITLSESLGIKFATSKEEGGVHFGVPYIAHLDKDNKILEEGIKMEDIKKYIE